VFDTKIAIVLLSSLKTWQKLNVTSFLTSGIIGQTSSLIGEKYTDGSNYGVFTKKVGTLTNDYFKNLLAELKQKNCSIFMGPSGVGKTTLLNMIIPGLQKSTAPVSNKIKRGKNTTRNVELFTISKQSYIVDTPGFNMQPLEVDIKLLPNLYSEIYKQVIEEGIKCKYRNCLHLKDEGCNLNKSFERYPFYKEMIESSKSHYYRNQED